jgi:hypothetical protein
VKYLIFGFCLLWAAQITWAAVCVWAKRRTVSNPHLRAIVPKLLF